jgi:hypothetical protein
MFGSIISKFVNFTRFPVIFDIYKPYDAIYKRAFAGAFLSDVNQDSYRKLNSIKHLHHYGRIGMVYEICVKNTQHIV